MMATAKIKIKVVSSYQKERGGTGPQKKATKSVAFFIILRRDYWTLGGLVTRTT